MVDKCVIDNVDAFLREIEKWREAWKCPDGFAPRDDVEYGIFRGQADHHWPLRSRVSRLMVGHNTYSVEAKLFRAWCRRHLRYRNELEFDPSNTWEVLACGQHYGLPTRLLDWTTCPLHALFFACVGEPQNADGIVYGVLPKSLDRLDPEQTALNEAGPLFDRNEAVVYLYQPALDFSKRLSNQMGVFTAQSKVTLEFPESLEEASIARGVSRVEIRSLKIACAAKTHIEHMLRQDNGIGYEQMFPDPSGLARQICREYLPSATSW